MKNNSVKHIAHKILFQNNIYSLTNYDDLKCVIESSHFTIIEFKKYVNSKDLSELIKLLKIEEIIENNDSFIYIKNNLKILFINTDLPMEDKCSLLRHELGHIYDPDLKKDEYNYTRIKNEEFANEFSFYIKNPGIIFRLFVFLAKKWKLLISVLTIFAFVFAFSNMYKHVKIQTTEPVVSREVSLDSGNTFYITSNGKKYHYKNCIIVKHRTNLTETTLIEAVNSGYQPCLVCNPGTE